MIRAIIEAVRGWFAWRRIERACRRNRLEFARTRRRK